FGSWARKGNDQRHRTRRVVAPTRLQRPPLFWAHGPNFFPEKTDLVPRGLAIWTPRQDTGHVCRETVAHPTGLEGVVMESCLRCAVAPGQFTGEYAVSATQSNGEG